MKYSQKQLKVTNAAHHWECEKQEQGIAVETVTVTSHFLTGTFGTRTICLSPGLGGGCGEVAMPSEKQDCYYSNYQLAEALDPTSQVVGQNSQVHSEMEGPCGMLVEEKNGGKI